MERKERGFTLVPFPTPSHLPAAPHSQLRTTTAKAVILIGLTSGQIEFPGGAPHPPPLVSLIGKELVQRFILSSRANSKTSGCFIFPVPTTCLLRLQILELFRLGTVS